MFIFCKRPNKNKNEKEKDSKEEKETITSSNLPYIETSSYLVAVNPAYMSGSIDPGENKSLIFNGNNHATGLSIYPKSPQQIDETWISKAGTTLMATHPFDAENARELTVNRGQQVQGISTNGIWYMVKDPRTGQFGMVPYNYLQEF